MNQSSFLPEDYLAQKAERRTNLICLTLFAVVMTAVFGAFLVTNRQWTQIKTEQEMINAEYQSAATMIEELNDLEAQKEQMLEKAELAASLVERVPRSILFAEMINRMPPRLSLIDFDMSSEKIRITRTKDSEEGSNRLRDGRTRGRTRDDLVEEGRGRIEPPQYRVMINIVGVAPTDLEVSRFLKELNMYHLFQDVNLIRSESTQIEDVPMREFAISMRLNPESDVRNIEPRIRPRNRSGPMDDRLYIEPGDGRETVGASPIEQ